MRSHLVIGHTSGCLLGWVKEDGPRVECVAFVPWLLHYTLEHIGHYWLGDFNPQSTPESSALGWFS